MSTKASSGSAHTPRPGGGVAYVPQGGKTEKRFEPGQPLEKCPPEILEQYIERGDVIELAGFEAAEEEAAYEVPGLDVAPIDETTTLIAAPPIVDQDGNPVDDAEQREPVQALEEPETVPPSTTTDNPDGAGTTA